MNATAMPRPRVDAILRSAVASAQLTVLHAPLGAGKTVAAGTAFPGDAHTVWLQSEPWHSSGFVRALVQAVRQVRPDFGRLTLGALEAGASSTHLGRTFAKELTHIEEPLLLIVDNIHVFTGQTAFSRFIEAAMSVAPPDARIVALGRSVPDIALGKSVMQGRVRVLDGSFLAFTEQEVQALAAWMKRDVRAEMISQIFNWTEGWATGVSLALSAPDLSDATGIAPRAWTERYLAKQLLVRLDADTTRFLEDAAVFDALNVRVLQRLYARDEIVGYIAQLRRAGALVSETDSENFRVHPVLRQFAETRLRARDGLQAAHEAAAKAYADEGAIAAAMFHARAAGNPSVTAAFLRRHAEAALASGDYETVRILARQIAPNGSDGDVRLYVDALLEKALGSAEARDLFYSAAEASRQSRDDVMYFKASCQVVEHDLGHRLYGDAETISDLRRRAATLDDEARATVAVLDGWRHAIAFDFSGALACVAAADSTVFSCGILRAYAQTALGDADAAEHTLDSLVSALEDGDRVVMQTLTLIWFARLALLLGRVTTAADAASQAGRLAQSLDLRAEEAALYVALAEIATHTGRVQDAVRSAEHAKTRSEYAWYAADVQRVRAFSEIALARAAFLGHDNAIARELALRAASNASPVQRAIALSECAVYTLLSEIPASAKAIADARSAVAQAAPVDAGDAVALSVADDLLAFLDAANGQTHQSLLSGCEPFAGLLAFRRGLVTLEHAGVAVGKARRGEASAEAFDTALRQITRDGPRFEARLARAYASSFIREKKERAVAAPAFDMTARESEILRLLVEGLTNKEIAQRLVVSPRTVETHVERVLGKLEVGSRSRAIAKALRVGLVELS